VRLFWHKLTHWEYWPFWLVYVPIYFQWGFYALEICTRGLGKRLEYECARIVYDCIYAVPRFEKILYRHPICIGQFHGKTGNIGMLQQFLRRLTGKRKDIMPGIGQLQRQSKPDPTTCTCDDNIFHVLVLACKNNHKSKNGKLGMPFWYPANRAF